MPLSYAEMERHLMDELRLYHHPIAVTFLATDAEVAEFKRTTPAKSTILNGSSTRMIIAGEETVRPLRSSILKMSLTSSPV